MRDGRPLTDRAEYWDILDITVDIRYFELLTVVKIWFGGQGDSQICFLIYSNKLMDTLACM